MAGVAAEDLGGNLVLAALTAGDRERLRPHLRRSSYRLGEVLFEAGDKLEEVCFPLSGLISLLASGEHPDGVEIVTVGREGMIGVPLLLGCHNSSNVRAVCRMPSVSLKLRADAFLRWLSSRPGLPEVMRCYIQAQFIETAQAVLCSRLHSVGQRSARWLLLSHDRAEGDEFPITQESLAQMLGVRRASVTVAARALQETGLIEYRRGRVRVLDRVGLEDVACECYGRVREAVRRVAGVEA